MQHEIVGRDEEIQSIHTMLEGQPNTASKPVVLVGSRGVGTSALAKEYMHQNKTTYAKQWFFNAKREATLIQSYIDLAKTVAIYKEGDTDHDVVAKVTEYIGRMDGWLLVYDHVNPPDMTPETLLRYIPNGNNHQIVTSQSMTGWDTCVGNRPCVY